MSIPIPNLAPGLKTSSTPNYLGLLAQKSQLTAPTSIYQTSDSNVMPKGYVGYNGVIGNTMNTISGAADSIANTIPQINSTRTAPITTSTNSNTSANNSGTQSGNVTTANGGYAGSPANNPYYTANANNSTGGTIVQPTQNQGYGTSYGGVNSMGSQAQTQTLNNFTAGVQSANPSATPNYAAGQGYSGNAPLTQGIPGAFTSILNNLANTQPYTSTGNAVSSLQGQASGNNPAQGNINTLTGIGQNQTPAVTEAYRNLSNFNQQNPYLQSSMGALFASAPIAYGRGQLLANQLGQEQQGLANTYNAAVSGQNSQVGAATDAAGHQLTGQSQQITAANNAGNLSNTAQSNQIGAQNDAQQNLINSLGQQGYVILNKLTGQPLSTGGAQSAAAYGGSVNAAEQNAQTVGTAVTGANAQGLGGAIQDYQNLNTQVQSAEKLGQSVLSALDKGGINLSNSTDYNAAVNNLSQRLGSSNYTNFLTSLNDARNAYQGIFTASGQATPTDAAASMAVLGNPNSTVGQIYGAINTLNQNAFSGRLQPAYQKVQAYQTSLGGNSGNSGNSNGYTGNTVQTSVGAVPTDY